MQITGGLISIASGTPDTGTGDSSCDWSQVVVNCWFVHAGQVYQITSVDNQDKVLTISPDYAGTLPIVDEGDYVIVRDFTSNLHLPLLNPGDPARICCARPPRSTRTP